MVYIQVMDSINSERKKNMEGQMSLFDFVSDEQKKEFEIQYPDMEEFDKDMLLAFEKEVLGIYVSGHPLQEYENMFRKNISALTTDFEIDDELGEVKVEDGSSQIIGGMITSKTVKTTRTNSLMAFITIEDLVGTVEVIVFPRDYEKYKTMLIEDNKVFIRGKVNAEEDRAAKLICQEIIPFEAIPKKLYIRFKDKEEYLAREKELFEAICDSEGNDTVTIVCTKENAIKQLGRGQNVKADGTLVEKLTARFGEGNVAIVEGSLGKMR